MTLPACCGGKPFERKGGALPVPQLALDCQALLMKRLGSGIVALFAGQDPQVAKRVGDAPPVAEFPPNREALLLEFAGGGIVTCLVGHQPQVAECKGDAPLVSQFS